MATPPQEDEIPSAAEMVAIRHGATRRNQAREGYERAMRGNLLEWHRVTRAKNDRAAGPSAASIARRILELEEAEFAGVKTRVIELAETMDRAWSWGCLVDGDAVQHGDPDAG
ncbi:MAG: hypothetical protein M3R06_05980 [Chloroflexota bacterium]|nr:hypothetical protein [Chloroflexota bacterium]